MRGADVQRERSGSYLLVLTIEVIDDDNHDRMMDKVSPDEVCKIRSPLTLLSLLPPGKRCLVERFDFIRR